MLLPPHTTMTTGPRRRASLPSSCSLLIMSLYTAERAAPQAGSTSTFSSSAERVKRSGGISLTAGCVALAICCVSVQAQVVLTYKAFHSFHSLLVCDHLWENCVLIDQFKSLCRHSCQAKCGCNTRGAEGKVSVTPEKEEPCEKNVAQCWVYLVFLPGDFR